jgi:signal transduction histidine kinase
MFPRRLPEWKTYRLAVMFTAVVAVPSLALLWLGIRLVLQEHALAEQREREQRQVDLAAAVTRIDRWLGDVWKSRPEGAVRLTVSGASFRTEPSDGVLWLPEMAPLRAAADLPFLEGERQEFRGDLNGARAGYEKYRVATERTVRAGALYRLARLHWKEKRWGLALRDYQVLATIEGVAIDGLPVSLVARRAMCGVLAESGQKAALDREAERFRRDLLANVWMLDEPAWEFAAAGIAEWTGRGVAVPEIRRAMSEAVRRVWTSKPARPATLRAAGQWLTVLSRQGAEGVELLVLPQSVLEQWVKSLASTMRAQITIVSGSGEPVAGAAGAPQPGETRAAAAETQLPWTLVARPPRTDRTRPEEVARERMLAGGLAALLMLVAGGGYLLWRAVQRELAVARLQTDFVAAVSHEFRTPLASLRHVTELLGEDDGMPADRRRDFYAVLGRNTERLQRLVESLLDFARMEEGRKPYDLRPLDVTAFAHRLVDEFRKEVAGKGFRVDLEGDGGPPIRVLADEAALSNAVWNLLDNAVKYSPGGNRVRVAVTRMKGGVAITVTDEGMGIAEGELREIFGRFVRGSEAKRLGLKGTGLGLSMATHIAKAHGGELVVESEAGKGSTFRLVLPEGR